MIIYTSNIICAVFMHQVYSFHERKHGYSSVSANKISSSFPRNQYQSFVTCYGWIRLFTRAAKTGETAWSDTILLKSLFFFFFFLFLKFLFLVTTPFPVEFHGIEGAEVLSKENPSFENHKESMKIVELVENLCDDGGFGFNLTSICVVAFYPAQVKFKFLFGYWTFYCRKPWNLEIKIECSNVEYRYQQSV